MRVFRTILGMLLLTIGLPTLLGGGGLWAVMQHRDPGGAFSGELQRLTVPGHAVVIPDIDRLLRDHAPFARIDDTQLRLSAATVEGRAFLGLAPSDAVARYLAHVPYTRIDGIDIGTGVLPVTASRVGGHGAPTGTPARQPFWTASGHGQISLTPAELTDRPYSLVLMNPDGAAVLRLAVVAEVRPGWLGSGTWGLLTLGTLLVMAGVIVLVWPGRRREVVYVVEPSQVPELMHAIGAPLPLPGGVAYFAGARTGGAHRPRTLADTSPRPPALPQFAWPPNAPAARTPELPAGEPVTLATATLNPTPGGTATRDSFDDDPDAGYPAGTTAVATLVAPAVPSAGHRPGTAPAVVGHRSDTDPAVVGHRSDTVPAVPSAGRRSAPAATVPSAGRGADTAPTRTALAATSGTAHADVAPAGARTPAPGQPLSMLGEAAAPAALQPGQVPARRGDKRPADLAEVPQFQATAVGAWVAATAPERARQTEARAAARLAEAAARRNAGKFTPTQPGSRNTPPNVRIPIAAPRRDNGDLPAQTPTDTPTPAPAEAAPPSQAATDPAAVPAIPSPTAAGKDRPAVAASISGNRADVAGEGADSAVAASIVDGKADVAGDGADSAVAASIGGSKADVVGEGADSAVAASIVDGKADGVGDETAPAVAASTVDGKADTAGYGTDSAVALATSQEEGGAQSVEGDPTITRIAVHTGPAVTDWIATGTSRIGPAPVPRPAPRPSPRPTPTASAPTKAQAPSQKPAPDDSVRSSNGAVADDTSARSAGTPPEWPPRGTPAVDAPAVPAVAEKAVPAAAEKAVLAVGGKAVPAAVEKAVPAVVEKAVPVVAEKAVPAAVEKAATPAKKPAAATSTGAPRQSTPGQEATEPKQPKPAPAAGDPGRSTPGQGTGATAQTRAAQEAAGAKAADSQAGQPKEATPGHADPEKKPGVPAPAHRSGPLVDGEAPVTGTDATTTAGSARASIHAAEATIPAVPSASVPSGQEAVVPVVERATPQSAEARRSVHAVEADGPGILPREPSPVPTRGAAAAAPGVLAGNPAGASESVPEAAAGTPEKNESSPQPTGDTKPVDATGGKPNEVSEDAVAGVKNATAAKRQRKVTGSKGGDDLVARAQGRSGGKATPARPAPTARRAPAAWIKAAESVAARAGRTGGEKTPPAPDGDGKPVPSPPPSRLLSYREEAAELLAGAGDGERRRKRTVGGRSRPGSEPRTDPPATGGQGDAGPKG
ncbi:hypothetical protein Aph02nite_73820 [Actinoplanes philippinensis]|uniref:Uncharacterized protein n=1 Tax=Actinoplanes philippinensis TaxID=35752 RepID=A0A1I2K4V7_9ACTN|nr:hypothetical protein [Actinoplanes philippinensis]GIE81432.1 hypothetical protein Aph02nite_73820 [Actinoplanes philippinensis]SFF61463.1 hypothetical protein SAMN05421541_11540 [Actinoplanes philippinensis]